MPDADHYALAVILPCYRDGAFLPRAVGLLEQQTPSVEANFVIIIAEDGSNSSKIVKELVSKHRNILYFHNMQRLGRGMALRNALRNVNADIYAFMDVDLSTDLYRMNAFSELIRKVRDEGFDLVTGSRYHRNSIVIRPVLRWLASLAYNRIVRLLFKSKISDHQCGFKAFSANLAEKVSDLLKSNSWFWDTEIIVIAQKKGLKVTEIPVSWIETRGSKTPILRLVRDVGLHGAGIVRLFWRVYVARL